MPNSPGSQPRSEVAPPPESTARGQRTGYLALAASGVVLATAFGTVAQFLDPGSTAVDTVATAPTSHDGNTGSGGTELVPGQAVPGETTVVIDGVAVTGTLPPSATSPTTVVSTGPDGKTTTTVITPPKRRTTTSAAGSTSTSSGKPTNPGTQLPPSSSSEDPEPSDPPTEPPPTDPTESPSGEPPSSDPADNSTSE